MSHECLRCPRLHGDHPLLAPVDARSTYHEPSPDDMSGLYCVFLVCIVHSNFRDRGRRFRSCGEFGCVVLDHPESHIATVLFSIFERFSLLCKSPSSARARTDLRTAFTPVFRTNVYVCFQHQSCLTAEAEIQVHTIDGFEDSPVLEEGSTFQSMSRRLDGQEPHHYRNGRTALGAQPQDGV